MADYYPLLAKAVANLPSRAAPTARRAIYERARKALIGQLRSVNPPMSEVDIANEDAALDQAIARVEAEYGAKPAAAPGALVNQKPATLAAATPSTPKPSPALAGPPSAAASKPGPTRAAPEIAPVLKSTAPGLRPPPPPWTAKPPATPPAAAKPLPKAPVAPALAARPIGASLDARRAPTVDTEPSPVDDGLSTSFAPAIAAYRGSAEADDSPAPPVAAASTAGLSIPSGRSGVEIARPIAPSRVSTPRRNPWGILALVALACVAGAIALAAFLWREKPQDLAIKTTTETTASAPPASQSKIAERVKAAGQADPAATAGETPIPTVTVPVAPVTAAPTSAPQGAPATTAPAPARAADVAQSGADSQPQVALAAASPGSSRAAMLIGMASDPQKPMVNLGSAVWSIIPAAPGQPSTLAIRIEVDIPDLKMHAVVTIRKNVDPSLPATHTIDLRTTFADGADIKGVKDIALPQLRKDDAASGDPISGVRVKINDSYYLVGLTRSDADAAHNLDLLSTRGWFDFPLLLNDDRIAKLTFAKGDAGDKVLAQALDAWK